jgi:hypothetical protein
MGPSPPPPSASAALKFSMPRIAAAALLGMQAHRLSATSKAQCHPLLARMSGRASLDRLHSTWPTLSGVSVSAIRLPDPSRRQCMSCMQEPRGGLAALGLPSEMQEGAFSCRTRWIWGAHQDNSAWKVHGVQQGSLAWSMHFHGICHWQCRGHNKLWDTVGLCHGVLRVSLLAAAVRVCTRLNTQPGGGLSHYAQWATWVYFWVARCLGASNHAPIAVA